MLATPTKTEKAIEAKNMIKANPQYCSCYPTNTETTCIRSSQLNTIYTANVS